MGLFAAGDQTISASFSSMEAVLAQMPNYLNHMVGLSSDLPLALIFMNWLISRIQLLSQETWTKTSEIIYYTKEVLEEKVKLGMNFTKFQPLITFYCSL